MSTWKEDFLHSFVQGFGKTTGFFTVTAVLSAAFYSMSRVRQVTSRQVQLKERFTQTSTSDDDDADRIRQALDILTY